MKIQHGHVSNSSSSSFLVAFKCDAETDEEKTKFLVEALLAGHTGIPIEPLVRLVAEAAVKHGFDTRYGDPLADYLEYWDEEREDCELNNHQYRVGPMEQRVRQALANGWKVGAGTASYNEFDDDIGEGILGNASLDINTDTVILWTMG